MMTLYIILINVSNALNQKK